MKKNKKYRLLIVEDEESIREMLRLSLERESYKVLDCETAEQAEKILHSENMSGIDFLKTLRSDDTFKNLPVIMLTAKAEEDDKLDGFDAGVDDYISKPFSLKEMLARIQSVLRRSDRHQQLGDIISLSGVHLNKESHRVHTDDNEEITLGPTEFKLLHFLMQHPDRVYSREQLLDNVWGIGVYVDERTVDVHIRRLRKALEQHKLKKVIRTVRGSGYSFIKLRDSE